MFIDKILKSGINSLVGAFNGGKQAVGKGCS